MSWATAGSRQVVFGAQIEYSFSAPRQPNSGAWTEGQQFGNIISEAQLEPYSTWCFGSWIGCATGPIGLIPQYEFRTNVPGAGASSLRGHAPDHLEIGPSFPRRYRHCGPCRATWCALWRYRGKLREIRFRSSRPAIPGPAETAIAAGLVGFPEDPDLRTDKTLAGRILAPA
jgi:hypothetical protein